MHSPGVRDRLKILRSVQIGRLAIEIVETERTLTCSRERVATLNDPSYLLLIPLETPLHFSQGGRVGSLMPNEYLLLSQRGPARPWPWLASML